MSIVAPFKLIVLTGGDRCGKATQTRLLHQALLPSQVIDFPQYNHWSGQILRAILRQESFNIVTQAQGEGPGTGWLEKKYPELFQCLNAINRLSMRGPMVSMLRQGHLICDRYAADALAYGEVDGCDPEWLRSMERLYLKEDLTFVFLGKPFPRPGEEPDINERDQEFQDEVAQTYRRLAKERDWVVIENDHHRQLSGGDPVHHAFTVHQEIRRALHSRLNLSTRTLPEDAFQEVLFPRELKALPEG